MLPQVAFTNSLVFALQIFSAYLLSACTLWCEGIMGQNKDVGRGPVGVRAYVRADIWEEVTEVGEGGEDWRNVGGTTALTGGDHGTFDPCCVEVSVLSAVVCGNCRRRWNCANAES